jgi:catechol 2,3-dioxygenase-like lactoylglutathione lyase family enzyme
MDHIVINIKNDERMISFYTQTLMLESERLAEFQAGNVPFPSVRLNEDTVIDLFPEKMWRREDMTEVGFQNMNHLCLALCKKDWDILMSKVRDDRVDIEEGPVQRWGAHGTGISAYFRDPEGNLIEARYYEDSDVSKKCLLTS